MVKLNKAAKAEIKANMDGLRSNVLDLPSGPTFIQFNYERGQFEAGGVCNGGMIVDLRQDYDSDMPFEYNFRTFAERVVEEAEADE